MRAFRGAYLETAQRLKEQQGSDGGDGAPAIPEIGQLDFEFVLFASAVVDYDYIMKLIAKYSGQDPKKVKISREQLIGLIQSDAKFLDEREEITEYVRSLTEGEGLDEAAIRAGYEQFKTDKQAREIEGLAKAHCLTTESLSAFVDTVLQRMVFDGEELTDLMGAARPRLARASRARARPHGRSRPTSKQASRRPGHFGPQRLRGCGRAMTAHQPLRLAPKLRFAEFRNTGDWMTEILDNQGTFLSSLTGKTAKDFDTGNATFIPYMNVFSNTFTNVFDLRAVSVGGDESQNTVAKGDVFFTISSEIPEEAGMSSVLLEEIENCYLNSFCALFRFDNGKSPHPVFLGYLLRSALARAHLSRGAQGATRYNISRATFRSLPLLLPSVPEQQKIADCLGSLDDLIAAESRKLDALRQHKEGLMQELFPLLGETAARLRFPKFQNRSILDELTIGDVCDLKAGDFIPASEIVEHADEAWFPCYGGNGFRGYVKSFTHDGRYVLVGRQGALCGNVKLYAGKFHATEHALVATPKPGIDTGWLFYALDALKLNRFSIGQAQPGLSVGILRDVGISAPVEEDEQQKIADCLGSLDVLITATGRKLETLRQHKQGLMQRLFPSRETV